MSFLTGGMVSPGLSTLNRALSDTTPIQSMLSSNPQFNPSFTPSGRGGIMPFLFGTPEAYFDVPGRRNVYEQLAQGVQGGLPTGFDFLTRLLSGDQSIFQELEAPALRQFQQEILPGLAERFTGIGQGAQGSSGYQQALGQAGARLAQDLAGQRAQYRMSALDRLMSQAGQTLQQRPYDIIPRTPGAVENAINAFTGTAGRMVGAR